MKRRTPYIDAKIAITGFRKTRLLGIRLIGNVLNGVVLLIGLTVYGHPISDGVKHHENRTLHRHS